MKIKHFTVTYLVIILFLFSGDFKETFATEILCSEKTTIIKNCKATSSDVSGVKIFNISKKTTQTITHVFKTMS